MPKKSSKTPKSVLRTKARELFDHLANDAGTENHAEIVSLFPYTAHSKVILLEELLEHGNQVTKKIDPDRLYGYLEIDSKIGLTAGSWANYFVASFNLIDQLVSGKADTTRLSKLLNSALCQYIDPPKGITTLAQKYLESVANHLPSPFSTLANALKIVDLQIVPVEQYLEAWTIVLSNIVRKAHDIDASQLKDLIQTCQETEVAGANIPGQLPITLSLICLNFVRTQNRQPFSKSYLTKLHKRGLLLHPSSITNQPVGDQAANHIIEESYDDHVTRLEESRKRLLQDQELLQEEISRYRARENQLVGDIDDKIRTIKTREAEWQKKDKELTKMLNDANEQLYNWQEEHKRLDQHGNRLLDAQKRETLSHLEKKLAKPANDTSLILRKILEKNEGEITITDLRRLGINFSKLHKSIVDLTNGDSDSSIPASLLRD